MLANRLTILYGESGSGKTSLLQAGLGPALSQRRALLAVSQVQGGSAFSAGMLAGLRAAATQAGLDVDPSAALADSVRALQHRLDGPVILVLDDGERYFEAFSGPEQAAVVAYFHDLLVDRSLDLRLVIVIREEFLGRMTPLEQMLPGLLDVRYRVDRLTREAAREAIEGPAQRFGVSWAPPLLQRVLSDLQEGESGLISPSQLQLISQRLHRSATEGDTRILSLADLEAAGGTGAILGGFLDDAISSLDLAQQTLAKTLLAALVTSNGQRQRLPAAELARTLGDDSAQASAQVQPLLDFLIDRSLVRRVVAPPPRSTGLDPAADPAASPPTPPDYELSHDYLTGHIIAWLGQDFWDTQQAREILRQAMPDWLARNRLLPAGDLALITAQHGLLHPTPNEARLLFASAVAYAQGVDAWQPLVADADQRTLLLALAQHEDATSRARALPRLANFPDPDVGALLADAALTDPAPSVREAATRTVAHISDPAMPTAVGLLAQAAQGSSPDPALAALTLAGDLAPITRSLLPKELAGAVQRRVWRERFRRNRAGILASTLRGLQGGFWGMGLGIGLYLGINLLLSSGYDYATFAQNFRSLLFGVSAGIPVMGVIGAVATAVVAVTGIILTSLADRFDPRRIWLIQTGSGILTLALFYLLFAFVFPGNPSPFRALTAGGLIGLGLFGVATAPLPPSISAPARLGICAVIGVLTLFLAHGFALVFPGNFPLAWIVWTGAISGLGVAWGLPPLTAYVKLMD